MNPGLQGKLSYPGLLHRRKNKILNRRVRRERAAEVAEKIFSGSDRPRKWKHLICMIAHIRRLFVYDDWANREVLGAIRGAGFAGRPLRLLSHILSAERLWYERMKGLGQTFPVWPDFSLQQCAEQVAGLRSIWEEFLSPGNEAELSVPVSYKNTEGEGFTSAKEDVLLHVITHSAYHRGQIAAEMRAAGVAPAYTDFIHAVRRGFVD
jgi:uncharacterized damage-inducible protein DinB